MTEDDRESLITDVDRERIRAHYARVMPWLEPHFGGLRVVDRKPRLAAI